MEQNEKLDSYKKLYYRLFNGISDALEAMEKQNYTRAGEILRKAQQETEELYVENMKL